ncbi:MAG: hypothetical protein AB7E70_00555 [Hyphomicrobiaceae bacterium]
MDGRPIRDLATRGFKNEGVARRHHVFEMATGEQTPARRSVNSAAAVCRAAAQAYGGDPKSHPSILPSAALRNSYGRARSALPGTHRRDACHLGQGARQPASISASYDGQVER